MPSLTLGCIHFHNSEHTPIIHFHDSEHTPIIHWQIGGYRDGMYSEDEYCILTTIVPILIMLQNRNCGCIPSITSNSLHRNFLWNE